jgi:hypothetical protein
MLPSDSASSPTRWHNYRELEDIPVEDSREDTPCGLCHRIRDLQESHLISRAAYEHLREPTNGTDPNSISVTPQNTFSSSLQVKSHFLCRECEQRFHRKGENYVLTQCAHRNGQFKLREQLQAASPLKSTPQYRVYDAQQLLGPAIDHYLYFAASVFWRASAARRWMFGKRWLRPLPLGDKYREEFRLYLLEQAPFPPNARVHLAVASEADPNLLRILTFPCRIPFLGSHGVYRHEFYLLGLILVLYLGGKAPDYYDIGALNGRSSMIWLHSWRQTALFQEHIRMAIDSTPARSLRRRMPGQR